MESFVHMLLTPFARVSAALAF